MTTERILKNIFWRPDEAFKPELLEQTFSQSIVAFCILALLSSAVTTTDGLPKLHLLAKYPAFGRAPHIAAFLFFIFMFLFLCAHMWLLGLLIRGGHQKVNVKTLFTGALWISVTMLPLGWILHRVLFRLAWCVTFPYRVWLMTVCIRSVTGLSTRSSFGFYILSMAVIGAAFFITAIAIWLIFRNSMALPY